MKPTIENFVRHRLTKMIAKADREEKLLCHMCPGAKNFETRQPATVGLKKGDWHQACQESVGLKYIEPGSILSGLIELRLRDLFLPLSLDEKICPCFRLSPKLAEKRARAAVKKYAL